LGRGENGRGGMEGAGGGGSVFDFAAGGHLGIVCINMMKAYDVLCFGTLTTVKH
jgi:hypothetical protein